MFFWKKIISLLIIILLTSSIFIQTTIAYQVSNKNIQKAYNKLIIKVIKKYLTNNKRLTFLKKLDNSLKKILKTKKIWTKKTTLIKDLIYLNNLQINSYLSSNTKNSQIENNKIFEKKLKENSNKEKIDSYPISKYFKNISYNKNHIFLENWVWYTYIFEKYLWFNDVNNEDIVLQIINHHNINTKKDLLFFREDWKLWFVKEWEYKKIKLVSNSVIKNISNKYVFLKTIKKDKEYVVKETDNLFLELKKQSIFLTKWLNKDEKIKVIYNYILENISYTKGINFNNINKNKKVSSGIETYRNKNWVCEWYVRLFMYMLNFAWISNTQVILWYVVDAKDFPNLWHAWIRIEDLYYDPTFDDPIWTKKTKQLNEYKFFALPYDLFYTNRFLDEDLPEFLKTRSINYRKKFVNSRINNLLKKYKNNDYLLLKPFRFKSKYNISFNESIKLDNLTKILPLYEVSDFSFKKNWVLKNIKKFKYFSIKEDTLEQLIAQLSYNLDWYYYFKWDLWKGKYEYRLGYDVEFK